MDWPLVILFGFCVGILVGTTGVGGGSLMTPALILVFGTAPTTAIGTDLAYAAVTKTVGGWRHWRSGTVDMKLALWLAVGSIPGALGGVYVLHVLEEALGKGAFDDTLLKMVGAALLITAVAVLFRALIRHVKGERDTVEPFETRHKLAAVLVGVSVGFVLGLTSAGSGALIAVGLIMLYRLTPRRVVGTDVFHAALLLWVASIAHLVSGNVDLLLAGNILIGSIPGVWIGSGLATRVLPEGTLRPALGTVLLAAGLALLNKAGLDFPIYVIFLVPALVALALTALHFGRERVARTRTPRPSTPSTPPAPESA
ncbi:MAG: sulfite exporter TauE/SafE family protein [Actinobacteria bacterium]|nr:sulfite exporter TauE/SafE family protein [Actinomycetota bacterium]